MSGKYRLSGLLCVGLLLISSQLQAGWRQDLAGAQQVGAGELRMFGFAIYDAELWSPAARVEQLLAFQQPFALQLTYRRDIGAEDLVGTSVKEILRLQPGTRDTPQLQRWQAEMRQAFVDVAPGERITGVFLPGRGARFYVGDTLQHEVSDEAFARAFFSIWLDPRTRTPDLRDRLIGAVDP